MVNLTTGAQSLGALASVPYSSDTSAASVRSFTEQFAATLEAYLSQAGLGAHFEIDIDSTQGQNPDTRQFLVTIRNPPAITSGPAPVVPRPVAAALNMPAAAPPVSTPTVARPVCTPPVVVPAVPPAPPALTGLEGLTSDFLASDPALAAGIKSSAAYYWALQPPEVQKLRDIPIFEERAILGQKLADQGYVIDPTIMVYGWNPYQVMKNRQDGGYTWVPSFSQPSVQVPPGLSFPGLPSYDRYHPPAGSIRVTTDFSPATQITY